MHLHDRVGTLASISYTTMIRCIQQIYNPSSRFGIDKPQLEGQGVYQWKTFDDQGQGSYVCCIYCNGCGSYDKVLG